MSDFDEEKQNKQIDDLKKREEEDLVQVLAESKYNLPYADLTATTIENDALRLITEKEAREAEAGAFKLVAKHASLAVRSPQNERAQTIKADLENRGYTVDVYMVSNASLEKIWERYKDFSFATEGRSGGLDVSSNTIAQIKNTVHSLQDAEHYVQEVLGEKAVHTISRLLEVILGSAIAIDASDIHIEPAEESVRLRFRLDGVLQDITTFPFEMNRLLTSRIKLLSGLKLTLTSTAQDGRFSAFLDGEEISFRTSVIPGAYGESIVMRILNPKSIQVNIEDLGMNKKLYDILMKEIAKPNGLILLTGPTGSGKTTTLYAFLKKIYSSEVKIITIEDPIEYHLAGITQTQTDERKGYTFLEGLRSALRQDPDKIMVGEIRDPETAKIAVESALTGHMVFSTLHTNNAEGVIPRLIDLDINPKILPSALSVSIAQRLIRKLCTKCKVKRPATEEETKRLRAILETANAEGKDVSQYGIDITAPIELYEAKGCDTCNNTGYKGRLGIFEAILSDENIEKIITTNPSEREIKKAAQHQGILDMKEDGVIKIIQGITDIPEVESVVDLDED